MKDLYDVVRESFRDYAGAVISDRAIVDVRDCLKPSPRMLLYYQYKKKNRSDKPHVKSAKIVGGVLGDYYVHGDSSAYGIYTRMAQPFSMRYPLEDFQGNVGNLMGDPPAAMRYTECRLNHLASEYLFQGLDKNAVKIWKDNFDETETMPSVLPSVGFYNICNGSVGLGIGISSSIPQFNLREVNAALIRLIENPDSEFSTIYCAPDFATGGIITNAAEVKESIRVGKGTSIRIRGVAKYDAKNNSITITEVPYGVTTSLITSEINEIMEREPECGIEKYNDGTGLNAELTIYLAKEANPQIILKRLYKETSLESWFSVNMTMLEDGRFPKVFGWREACQAYIEHIRECKTREIQYDLDMLIYRNHILEGLLVAIANIDDVIALIKNSESSVDAKNNLMKKYHLDEDQAKAILDIKLQRLAKLEAIKINNELEKNISEITSLRYILNTPEELNRLLIDALNEVSKKFGDARRTKVLNIIDSEEEEEEEVPVMLRIVDNTISFTKKKLSGQIIETTNLDTLIGFSADGKMYKVKVKEIPEGKGIKFASLFKVSNIIKVYSLGEINQKPFLYFSTKLGYIKKSNVSDYNYSGRSGTKTLKLRPDDAVTDVLLTDETKGIWYKTLNGHSSSARKIVKALKSTGISAYGTLMEKENKIMGLMEKENDD